MNNIENPIPQKYQMSPISELFTANYFPNDPQIDQKRIVLQAAYEIYCSSVPGCHELPKILHISKSEIANLKSSNRIILFSF